MRSCLLALLIILGADILPAQQSPGARVAAALSADVLRGHLEFLADDALEGRAPGTRGGETAAEVSRTRSSGGWASSRRETAAPTTSAFPSSR